MQIRTVYIAKEFSREPFGRDEKDGPYNGKAFREKFLKPSLNKGEKIILNFDGAEGYGSSFLDHAFAGLIRDGYTFSTVKELIEFISEDDPSVIDEINEYLEDEHHRSRSGD